MTPIRSATSTAAPRTSTGLPVDRWVPARSTTVTANPALASQYASVDPAIPATEISTVCSLITKPPSRQTVRRLPESHPHPVSNCNRCRFAFDAASGRLPL
jgi:hypothetical protein